MNYIKNLLLTIKPEQLLLLAVGIFFMLACSILIALWIYRDASDRGIKPLLWIAAVIIINPFLGLVFYLLIGRTEEKQYCPNCGSQIHREALYCEHCGEKRDLHPLNPAPPPAASSYRYLITAAVLFLLSILCMGLFIILAVLNNYKL